MKKLVVVCLAFGLTCTLFGCGGDKASEKESGKTEVQEEVKDDAKEEPKEEPQEESKEEPQEVAFEEMVVVDNEECMIKITGIEKDDIWGFGVNVELENKSAEKTYMYALENANINGVDVDDMWAEEVAPGKKAKSQITFLEDELEKNGIGDYTAVELKFRVHDTNNWEAANVAEETVQIYPFGEEKAVAFERADKDTDRVIVDNEHVKVLVTGYGEDEYGDFGLDLFIVNKTDVTVMCAEEEASVNGYMVEPFFATTVSAGHCKFTRLDWMKSSLEENGIQAVENVEFKFRVYNENDWMQDPFYEGVFQLDVQ